ncbi:PREDICTED: adrenocortical dysplasia protein homolog isoform X4 [Bison bison bison]|uniref:Adrenocortical dysplasia protein homolog isoform X4 n=1 Tax=Bison bison bison TaxID=43346 RepID=A0A6P3I3S9_BISBB|nr:PREDICTED: adrenocortical dysplasia protein homolog isoform X4 [Bison bison bison]
MLGTSLRFQSSPSPSEPVLGPFLPSATGDLKNGPNALPLLGEMLGGEAGPRRTGKTRARGYLRSPAAGMASFGGLVLRPWIRELVLGSDALSSPRAGQLLKVLQEAKAQSPSGAPDPPDAEAMLLVSDGTHSIRCLVTGEALNASDWEEKEFGFRGTEGRILLLRDCKVSVQVAQGDTPAEFYLQVDRFALLPTEQPREQVTGCNEDPDVRKKLCDCLEEHLSESTSSNTGPDTAAPITPWAASRCRATGEAVYTVPSLRLHISENDQQILSSLGPTQRVQGPERSPSHLALQDLSLSLISSPPSSPSSSGPPAIPSHLLSKENSASVSLLPPLPLAAPDPVQKGSSQPLSTICSAHGSLPPGSPHPSSIPNTPLLSCTPSLSRLGHAPSIHQAHVSRAQKPSLEFKELGLPPKTLHHSPRTRTTKGALESSCVWTPCPLQDPPERHRDGSAFQYEYRPPCPSLCAQVQAARLPPQLVAWALHFLMEPQPDSELTQM